MGILLMSRANSTKNNGNQFKRYPATRVFIEDLKNGAWNDEEKIFATRYGQLKRVRICGIVNQKKKMLKKKKNLKIPF